MPRDGYRSITLPEGLFNQMSEKAKLYLTSCPELIQKFLKIAWGKSNFDVTFPKNSSGALVIPDSNLSSPTTTTCCYFSVMLDTKSFQYS